MRFTPAFLEEIRNRLPVSAVVGRRVKLRKQGREFIGLSPFNAEKSPSFTVNDQKGFYHDFSSGKHGDIFSFVMETEGLGFTEAVERLAAEAGLALPSVDPRAEEREKVRASLYEVLDLAARHFEATLQSPAGSGARAYLGKRRLGPPVQKQFRIGYAPDSRNGLKEFLAGKGVTLEAMIEAGLLVSGDDVPVAFDRFRDRVMFPIADFRGRIVGFGGRALGADVPAKYLNSPETPLFHKGTLLYNGAEARKAAHDAGTVIAVEGYVDAIAMSVAGFPHTVAPLGTALTETQLELLWRMAPEPILCFDGDGAGKRAAFRALDLALPHLKPGRTLRFALLPQGQDPDDLIGSAGPEAMREILAAATPFSEMLWTRETQGQTFDTPESRAELEVRVAGLARSIPDPAVRKHYEQAMAERVAALFAPRIEVRSRERNRERFRGGRQGFDRRRNEEGWPIEVTESLRRAVTVSRSQPSLREVVLVMSMANHPALLAEHLDEFSDMELSSHDLARFRHRLVEIVAHEPEIGGGELRARLQASPHAALLARLDEQLARVGLWQVSPSARDSDALEGWRQAAALQRRAHALHKELKDAETALAADASDAHLARIVEIQRQLASAEGLQALIDGFGAQ
ncbi:MAG: DNA primase [Bauldia sp.]|nr:DNA primase [Bauldia sp.]